MGPHIHSSTCSIHSIHLVYINQDGTNQVTRARLLAAAEPHTTAWVQAPPVTNLGLHLDDETVRVAVALRLGAVVCEPHPCQLCQCPVDRQDHHGLSCVRSAGRHARHSNLNDVLRRALCGAGLESVLEPAGLDRGDGRRPDGLTLFPYSRGKSLVWDATCSDTFSATAVIQSTLDPGSAARGAEERKRARYASLCERYIFAPATDERPRGCTNESPWPWPEETQPRCWLLPNHPRPDQGRHSRCGPRCHHRLRGRWHQKHRCRPSQHRLPKLYRGLIKFRRARPHHSPFRRRHQSRLNCSCCR